MPVRERTRICVICVICGRIWMWANSLVGCLTPMNRRRFFSTLTSAFAAGAAAPALAQQPATPPKIDRLRLDAAESIFGVDFTEAEEQMALGTVNRNLDSFEQLRALNIPLDTEPAVTFRPYLPGKKPIGKATPGAKVRFTRTTAAAGLTPDQIAFLPLTALAVMIETKKITSTELTKIYLERLKKHGDTPEVCRVADRRARAQAGRRARMPTSRRASTAARCTASRGAPRTCSPPRATRRPGARRRTRIRSSTSTPRWSSACATRAPCWSPSCRWARWHKATCGSAARRTTRGTSNAARADRRPARAPPRRRVWSAFRSAPRRCGSIISPSVTNAASSACARPTAASAATARWRCAGRWTRSGRCAGRSKTACWC